MIIGFDPIFDSCDMCLAMRTINLAILGAFFVLGATFGLQPELPKGGPSSADALLAMVVAFIAPQAYVWLSDAIGLSHENLQPPDLRRFSLNPWQPIRFSSFFGVLCLSVGVPGVISEAAFRGIGANLGAPALATMVGLGLVTGTLLAIRLNSDRIVFDEGQ